jgi:hypothetical protein
MHRGQPNARSVTTARAGVVITLIAVVGVVLAGWAGSARAQDPFTVTVTGSDLGPDTIDLAGLDYAAAVAALQDVHDRDDQPRAVNLLAAPTGTPQLTSTSTTFSVNDDTSVLVVQGGVTLLGNVAAELRVVADWNGDGPPDVVVLLLLEDAGMTQLVPTWDTVDVGLDRAWLALAAEDATVVAADLPDAVSDMLEDGSGDTDLVVPGGGAITLRGTVVGAPSINGGLLQALGTVGVSGDFRLDGTLSSSPGLLGDPTDGTDQGLASLALSATVQTTTPAAFPEWLVLAPSWTVDFRGAPDGSFSAGIRGGLTATIHGTAYPATGAADISLAADGTPTVGLTASMAPIQDLFGASWLDLEEVVVSGALSEQDVAVSVAAATTVAGARFDVELQLGATQDGGSASVELSTDASLSASALASSLGADAGEVGELLDVRFDGATVYVGVEGTGDATSLRIAAAGEASLTLLSGPPVSAAMLLRLDDGDLLVAARPTASLRLSSLLGDDLTADFDPELPQVALVATNRDVRTSSEDLDGPSARYFDGLYCDDAPACTYEVEIDAGVGLVATIELPDELQQVLQEVGLRLQAQPLVVRGAIPLFGGTDIGLRMELPGLDVDNPNSFVKGGTLSVAIAAEGTALKLSLEGDMVVAIPRVEGDGACVSGTRIIDLCVDLITFDVDTTLSIAPTGGVSLDLFAGISGDDDGWVEPFGVPWLTLYETRLNLGVTAGGGGSSATVDLGFVGRSVIGDKDLTLAMKVGVKPEAPWIDFQGFTGASAAGLNMTDLAWLIEEASGGEVVLTETELPAVGARNLFLSFGKVDQPELCLRAGFYLTADLVLGIDGAGANTPGCLPPGTDAPAATETCTADTTCIATVLIDVDTGTGTGSLPRLTAAGYVDGWTAGPVQFDPTEVLLSMNSTGFRLFLTGGAELRDPIVYVADPTAASVWARGGVTLDVYPTNLLVEGDLRVSNEFQAYVKGTGKLDLSGPDFDLMVSLRSQSLEKLAAELDRTFRELSGVTSDFAGVVGKDAPDAIAREYEKVLNSRELQQLKDADLTTFVAALGEIQTAIDAVNGFFVRAGLPAPLAGVDIVDAALFGLTTPNFPGVRSFPGSETICVLWTPFTGCIESVTNPLPCLGFEIDGRCWLVPPSKPIPDVPGLCTYAFPSGHPLCRRGTDLGQVLRDEYVEPAYLGAVEAETQLDLPDGIDGGELLSMLDRKLNGAGSLRTATVASSTTDVTCGSFTVDYASGKISDTVLDVAVRGNELTLESDVDLQSAPDGADNAEILNQEVFDELLEETGTAEVCQPVPDSAPASTPTGLTLQLDRSRIDEGDSVTATGTVAGSTPGSTVVLNWGDGTAVRTVAVDAVGSWQDTHTYLDDQGAGDSRRYLVTATLPATGAQETATVTVDNVAPRTLTAVASDGPVDEGSVLGLALSFEDPGLLDTHLVTIAWGDGTEEERTVTASGQIRRELALEHVYLDDDPSGTAVDPYDVVVTVVDKDGGQAVLRYVQQVANVAPTVVSIEPVEVLDGPEKRDDEGRIIVTEGSLIRWELVVADPSPVDLLDVSIDFGDGSEPVEVERVPSYGDTERIVQVAYRYVDDAPTGTPSDPYTITVEATDDDLGRSVEEFGITVFNVAPGELGLELLDPSGRPLALDEEGRAVIDEGDPAVTLGFAFTDPGERDDHDVLVDWGDGWSDGTRNATTDAPPPSVDDRRETRIDMASGREGQVQRRYGDAGVFAITVTVTDDDTGAVTGTIPLVVRNTNPSSLVDTSWATSLPGGDAFLTRAAAPTTFSADATDRGSDDLTFAWSFADGNGRRWTSLWGGVADLAPSPQYGPREVTDEATHAWTTPCRHDLTLDVVDDDGGTAMTRTHTVLVTRPTGEARAQGHGWWGAELRSALDGRRRGTDPLDAAQLRCYLDIVGYASSVLDVDGPNGLDAARRILDDGVPGARSQLERQRAKLDRELLAAWLDFANGVHGWDEPVAGRDAPTFGRLVTDAENLRRESTEVSELARMTRTLWSR